MSIHKRIEELEKSLAKLKEEVNKTSIHTVKVGNLEWQADIPGEKFTFGKAKKYAASLGEGWRLPTIQELLTLVDYEKHAPACSVFPDCPSECFWSSSSAYSGNATLAWLVDFRFGNSYSNVVGNTYRVRCVRDIEEE